MSEIALRVENLSKLYTIGRAHARAAAYDTLRDQIANRVRSLFSGERRRSSRTTQFWALDDVSFEVQQGDVVGVIGRNGAGKSTLLKILSRITAPTKGRAQIYGRVGSLLEVGTGFHPELTGRENVYLNGAILGMTTAEINRKFDDIVAFSEIEQFVDTPVKRYSSGMYVRLAFAVAAHLEPEVLIVDEVLAVGDTAFQSKCLGKISEVAGHGRTVLFVSHNMAAVQHLCKKALLLQQGKLVLAGDTVDVVDRYLQGAARDSQAGHSVDLTASPSRPPAYKEMLTRIEVYTDRDTPAAGGVKMGAPLICRVSFRTDHAAPVMDLTLIFNDHLGRCVLELSSLYQHDRPVAHHAGEHTFCCEIPSLTVLPGDYHVSVFLDINRVNVDRVEDALRLHVLESDYYGGGKLPRHGFFVLKNHWYDEEQKAAPGRRTGSRASIRSVAQPASHQP
jgi:lipopolysaccharide transport system ATP-binding protein